MTVPDYPDAVDECVAYALAEQLVTSARTAQTPDPFTAWWRQAQQVPADNEQATE